MLLGLLACLDLPGLRLTCPLNTHPRWLQNGHPAEELSGVRVASQGATLHIDHVELGHAGLFACQATNEAGTAAAEVELSVHGERHGQPKMQGWVGPKAVAVCAFDRWT